MRSPIRQPSKSRVLASAAFAALAAMPAYGGTRYWDGATPAGAPGGGTGTWNTSTTNWDASLAGSDVAWNNANNDTAVFAGTAGTVTLGVPITVGGLQFDTAGYVVTGSALNFGAASNIVTNANATISSLLYGSDNITKTGTGTLTLSGATSNNYSIGTAGQFSGTTQITAGKISLPQVGGTASVNTWSTQLWKSVFDTTGSTGGTVGLELSAASTTLVLGGLSGNVNTATAVITNYGTMPSLVLNNQQGVSVSYGGVISNGAANTTLIKVGSGTQTLTNANTYSGATTVGAGTLALSDAGTAQNSAFTVRGGTLLLDNTLALADRLNNTTALSLGSLTLKSNVGAGTQSEAVGATTFAVSGKVTVDLNGGTDQTTLALGNVTRNAGAAIDFVGVGGTLGAGANSPNVTSSLLTANTNGILPWATVNGTQWAENNSNSVRAYSGSFFAINSSTNAQNAQVTGSGALTGARVANSINLISTGAGQSLALAANNLTLGSAASSPGAILKSGTDAYTISGTGQVRAGSAGGGTELVTHVDGGALTISAPLATAIIGVAKGGTGDLILSGTRAATMSGAFGIAGGNLEFQGSSTTVSGAVTGSGGLVVNLNAGQTLTLSNNANSYTGRTLVKGGTLKVDFNAVGLPGGTSTWFGYQNTSIAGSNLELNGGVFASTYGFGRTLGPGPDQVQITGGTSGFNVSGTPTFTLDNGFELIWGSTYFQPSVFVLNDATATAAAKDLTNGINLNGATRTINSNHASNYASISGVIRNSTGTAGLTKTGVGTLSLTNASNSWNGNTTISGGILDLAGVNTANIGGGSGRNISVASGASVRFNALSNAILNRIVETSDEIGVMTGSTSNNLDFSSSTGANLPNAFLGNWANNGAKMEYSGTLTPASDNYRLGAPRNSGLLGMTNSAPMTGSQGLIIGNGSVQLVGAKTFVGDTVIRTGARLGLAAFAGSEALSLQNSVLDVGAAGGTFWLHNSTATGPIIGSLNTTSAVFGGLKGSRDLSSVYSTTTGANNSAAQAVTAITGFTLNVGTGNSVTYSGAIGGFGTGASGGINGASTLTKTGAGTQILTGVSTYTGATTITGGTLAINSAGSINGSNVTINGGTLAYNSSVNYNKTLTFTAGTLAGTNWNGTLAGLTIGASNTISPGNSPGTAATGAQTWATGGSYLWEINNATGTAGTDPGWDLLNGTGTLNITASSGSEFTIEVTSLTLANAAGLATSFNDATSYNWLIADFASVTGFNASDFILDTSAFANAFTGTFGIALGDAPGIGGDATQVYLTYTAVPEPTTLGLLAMGAVGLLRRRRVA